MTHQPVLMFVVPVQTERMCRLTGRYTRAQISIGRSVIGITIHVTTRESRMRANYNSPLLMTNNFCRCRQAKQRLSFGNVQQTSFTSPRFSSRFTSVCIAKRIITTLAVLIRTTMRRGREKEITTVNMAQSFSPSRRQWSPKGLNIVFLFFLKRLLSSLKMSSYIVDEWM